MTTDPTAPATKGDLTQLASELRGEMHGMKDEILRHFDVVVENIRHDLEGANHDEIEVMKDVQVDHGDRITKMEQVVGLRP